MLKNNKGIKVNVITVEGDQKKKISDLVARETDLTIFVNKTKLANLNCTPGEYRYLGIGFLYSLGILRKKEDIVSVKIEGKSIKVNISNLPLPIKEIFNSHSLIEIQKLSSDKTGLLPVIDSNCKISQNTIYALISKMQDKAVFFKLSGGVHSCALAGTDGSILLFSEDISRYNTIDRILGEALLKDISTDDKIMLTSCRITSGIITKMIAGNVPIIISRSAPTDCAVDLAHQNGMTLIGFARGKRMNIYTHPERVDL